MKLLRNVYSSTRRHMPEDSRLHSNWRVKPLSQPCDFTCGSLHRAHSTNRSRARGCQRHSFVLRRHLKWENLS